MTEDLNRLHAIDSSAVPQTTRQALDAFDPPLQIAARAPPSGHSTPTNRCVAHPQATLGRSPRVPSSLGDQEMHHQLGRSTRTIRGISRYCSLLLHPLLEYSRAKYYVHGPLLHKSASYGAGATTQGGRPSALPPANAPSRLCGVNPTKAPAFARLRKCLFAPPGPACRPQTWHWYTHVAARLQARATSRTVSTTTSAASSMSPPTCPPTYSKSFTRFFACFVVRF